MTKIKTYQEALKAWEAFKKTPSGKLYVIGYFPFHMARMLFLYLAEKCSNPWIIRAAKLREIELQKAYENHKNSKEQLVAKNKCIMQIAEEVNELKTLIEDEDKVASLNKCAKILSILQRNVNAK